MMLARNKKIIAFLVTFLVVMVVDQVSKALVVALMEPGDSVTLIPHFLSITYARNTGAAFGLFAGSGQILFWSALVIVVITLIWFYRTHEQKSAWSFVTLGLMIGGAAGNLVDRVFRGKVVDFFDLGWWPVFNVADLAIVTGVIMLIVVMILEMTRKGSEKRENPEADG